MTAAAPPVLDRDGIAARIPHRGRMCLLDRLLHWDASSVECSATGHADPAHPLRSAGGLLAPCAVEYAAQAMALHGSLVAAAEEGAAPAPGYLASVRDVRFGVDRLDDVAGALRVRAWRLAGDGRQVLYRFEVAGDDGRPLAAGRVAVVLDTPPADVPAQAPCRAPARGAGQAAGAPAEAGAAPAGADVGAAADAVAGAGAVVASGARPSAGAEAGAGAAAARPGAAR